MLTHPSSHPYVDRLAGRAAVIVGGGSACDPDWVTDHAEEWELAHLHVGLDSGGVEWLPDVVAAHRLAGTPTVVTVHQLQPGHLPPDSHDVVDAIRAAAADTTELITLTSGCAAAIQAVTGRRVRVVPHGPLVPGSRRRRMRAHRRLALHGHHHVLVHVPALTPDQGLEELVSACGLARPALKVRVQVPADVEAAVRDLTADTSRIEVVGFDTMRPELLERSVADAAALVLPLRWGSHHPLIEVAADVGTPVITTTAGHLIEQLTGTAIRCADQVAGMDTDPVHVGVWNGRLDVPELARALNQPIGDVPVVPECHRERAEHAFISHHERLYHRLAMGVIDLST